MKITTKGRYAVRVMIDLAENAGGAAVPLRGISERQEVSLKYLEQIMTLLSEGGLVVGTRGNGGGYTLSRPASEISAAAILSAVEKENGAPLHEDANPKAAAFWQGLEKTMSDYLAGLTLEEIVKNSRSSRRDPSIWIL